ncbi:hypothetical protein AB4Z38_06845 [Arthrobacter sp. 2RAF6]|uniref:hypothetical protein n=1 Tax=Arthrobacter sp. 2RAF6 TaxID=3233002 RepID=UPI003F91C58D
MSHLEMIWEEPTKPIDAMAAELRANPGNWALVATGVSSGHVATWKRRGLQTRTVSVSTHPRLHDIYARFIGEPNP